jgi:hypothetical protein
MSPMSPIIAFRSCLLVMVAAASAACSGPSAASSPGPSSPAAPAVTEAPPGAVIADGEDAEQARTTVATGFVAALARRDDAAIAAYLDEAGMCKALIARRADPAKPEAACRTELADVNREALAVYRDRVPADFAAGEVTAYPLDAAQGIYMITVAPAGGDEAGSIAVTLFELDGRRYIVFPRKAAPR